MFQGLDQIRISSMAPGTRFPLQYTLLAKDDLKALKAMAKADNPFEHALELPFSQLLRIVPFAPLPSTEPVLRMANTELPLVRFLQDARSVRDFYALSRYMFEVYWRSRVPAVPHEIYTRVCMGGSTADTFSVALWFYDTFYNHPTNGVSMSAARLFFAFCCKMRARRGRELQKIDHPAAPSTPLNFYSKSTKRNGYKYMEVAMRAMDRAVDFWTDVRSKYDINLKNNYGKSAHAQAVFIITEDIRTVESAFYEWVGDRDGLSSSLYKYLKLPKSVSDSTPKKSVFVSFFIKALISREYLEGRTFRALCFCRPAVMLPGMMRPAEKKGKRQMIREAHQEAFEADHEECLKRIKDNGESWQTALANEF